MRAHLRQLRRIGWVLWGNGCVIALIVALPEDRAWTETAITVLFIALMFLGIPILLLTMTDSGAALRSERTAPTWARVVGYVLSVPQAALGLVTVIIGAAMIVWLHYATLRSGVPWYLEVFLVFTIWPMVFQYGVHLLRTTIRDVDETSWSDGAPPGWGRLLEDLPAPKSTLGLATLLVALVMIQSLRGVLPLYGELVLALALWPALLAYGALLLARLKHADETPAFDPDQPAEEAQDVESVANGSERARSD